MTLFDGGVPRPGHLERCPKCGLEFPEPAPSCPRCGIVFAKWKAPAPVQWLGPFIYKMVQVAPHVVAKQEKLVGNEAAAYLENVVNEYAAQGWEFFRVDEMAMSVDAPSLFGTRDQSSATRFHVITFRRPFAATGQ